MRVTEGMSTTNDSPELDPDGATGAGTADGLDVGAVDGGDATGGGSPGDPDDMGSGEEITLDDQDFAVEPENPQQLGGLSGGTA